LLVDLWLMNGELRAMSLIRLSANTSVSMASCQAQTCPMCCMQVTVNMHCRQNPSTFQPKASQNWVARRVIASAPTMRTARQDCPPTRTGATLRAAPSVLNLSSELQDKWDRAKSAPRGVPSPVTKCITPGITLATVRQEP
jgi:hypothetical protein